MPRSDKLATIGENFAILGELPHSACMSEFDFQPYLSTIIANQSQKSEDWRDGRYVETKAQLPLKVQTVKPQESPEQAQKQEAPQRFDVLAGLREFYRREPVLLIGKPGSGKSTALRRLLLEEAQGYGVQDGALIPVLILLRSCKQGSVVDWIAEGVDVEVAEVRSLLRAKRLLLLFDGLNEVPNLDGYQALTQFLEKPSQVPMVFTTRELGADSSLGIGRKLEMLPLTESQMREFIEMRLPGQGEQLIQQLGDSLRELAETPLLLNMLCQVFDPETGEMPKNRGELFRNKFMQDFDAIKHKGVVAADLGFFQFKDELLQHLAMKMIVGDGSPAGDVLQIEKTIAQGWLKDWLATEQVSDAGEKARIWLEDLVKHHLLQVAGDVRQIEFHHQLFQEYYAAEWLRLRVKNLDDDTLKEDYLNYWKWKEPVALMLGLVEHEALAVRVVEQALDVDLMLGARLAGEVRSDFQEDTTRNLSNKVIPYPKWFQCVLYGEAKTPIAVIELIKIAETGDIEQRRRVIHTFRLFSGNLVLTHLKILIQDTETSVRISAIRTLGAIRTSDCVDMIMKVSTDPIPSVREAAVFALRDIGSSAAIKGIIQILAKSESKNIQLSHMSFDSDERIGESTVRTMAIYFLQNLPKALVAPELLEYLNDLGATGTSVIVELLGKISNSNHEETVSVLSRLEIHPDPSVSESARGALWELKRRNDFESRYSYDSVDEDSADLHTEEKQNEIDYWHGFLDSPEPTLRCNAIIHIASCLGKDAVPLLAKALDDEDFHVVSQATNMLARCKTEYPEVSEQVNQVVPILIEKFEQAEQLWHRSSIAMALGIIGASVACPVLLKSLDNEDPQFRSSIIQTLGQLKCEVPLQILISAIADEDELTRMNAASSIAQVDQTGESLPALSKMLSGQSGESALEAIAAIQANCEFYNYEIEEQAREQRQNAQGSQQQAQDGFARIEDKLDKIDQRIKMPDQPQYAAKYAITGNPTIVEGNMEVKGDNVGTKNVYNYATDPNLLQTIQNLLQQNTDLHNFITELETQSPNPQTEAEAEAARDQAITRLQTTNPNLWQTIRHQMRTPKRQILNPERHAQAAKATLVEVTKAYWEKSLIAKAIITYIDKLSETPDQGA
jgi:HEAT repeat protein